MYLATEINQNKDLKNGWFGFDLDSFWDMIERIKQNFSMGLWNGMEETLKDVAFWVMSWNIWEVYNVRDWIKYLLTLSKFGLKLY